MSLAEIFERYRLFDLPQPTDGEEALVLACEVAAPAIPSEIADVWRDADVPSDVAALWALCREARLFVDVTYGQWGLALLSPTASAEQTALQQQLRGIDYELGDIVIGKFIGDQELLVVAPAETGARRVMVALETNPRIDWPAVGSDMSDFLTGYWEHGGDKYWE